MPLSMISAFRLGRYSDATVANACSRKMMTKDLLYGRR